MSDFETRARAAADALGGGGVGDPAAVRRRLRRRRTLRAVASSAVVVVGIGAFAVVRDDRPVRVHTVGSTAGSSTTIVAGSTTSSVPSTTLVPNLPDATESPNVIVGTDDGFATIRRGDRKLEQSVAVANRAYRMRDGSLIAQVDGPEVPDETHGIWRLRPGSAGAPIPELNSYRLLGSGIVSGDDVVFVAPPPPYASLVTQPAVVVYDVGTGNMRSIGRTSGAGEGSTNRVTIAGDILLVFGNDGQSTTTVDYYDVTSGNRITGRPTPKTGTEDLSGPSQVVISPDGARIAYVDTPNQWDANGAISKRPTDLVVVDARTGAELQRTTLTPSVDAYNWLEFDGRWIVASRFVYPRDSGTITALPAVVVDTQAPKPAPAQIPGAVGIATLDIGN